MVKRPLEVIKAELKIDFNSLDWLAVALESAEPFKGENCNDKQPGYVPVVPASQDVLLLRGALQQRRDLRRQLVNNGEKRQNDASIRALEGLLWNSMLHAIGDREIHGEMKLCNIAGQVFISVAKPRRIKPSSRATT